MDQVGLCLACWGEMKFINAPLCDVTGTPMPFGAAQDADALLSLEALENPPVYDKARIVAKFDQNSRRLIHKLKYQDQQHIGPLMAKMMAHAGRDLLNQPSKDNIICPVPLYHWRYMRRRFNQADLLARHVAKISRSTYVPLLVKRVKATKTQVGLSREQRQSNVKDAFKVNRKMAVQAQGKNIFIIDDVVTTGATVDEIAGCLKAQNLGPIFVLSFAKVFKAQVI